MYCSESSIASSDSVQQYYTKYEHRVYTSYEVLVRALYSWYFVPCRITLATRLVASARCSTGTSMYTRATLLYSSRTQQQQNSSTSTYQALLCFLFFTPICEYNNQTQMIAADRNISLRDLSSCMSASIMFHVSHTLHLFGVVCGVAAGQQGTRKQRNNQPVFLVWSLAAAAANSQQRSSKEQRSSGGLT